MDKTHLRGQHCFKTSAIYVNKLLCFRMYFYYFSLTDSVCLWKNTQLKIPYDPLVGCVVHHLVPTLKRNAFRKDMN